MTIRTRHLPPMLALVPNLVPALALALAGCSTAKAPSANARDYPALKQHATADIQVVLLATTIELTNTTGRAFGPSTVWLDKWYSRPIDALGVGQTLSLPLVEFRDRYSDTFKPGGFFATRQPDNLVIAQLETHAPDGADEMVGLVTVGGKQQN